MSDFNSLDIEHKRELIFNAACLYQAISKVAELIGKDKALVTKSLYESVKSAIDDMTDEEVEEDTEKIEATLKNARTIPEMTIEKRV